jgi:hypothetical protein
MKRAERKASSKEKTLHRDDLRKVGNIFAAELRLLVSNYYQVQEMRKRMDMQLRHLGDKQLLDISLAGPDIFGGWEKDLAKSFKTVLSDDPVANWVMAQRGIGHIITAGLLAHIDITRAPTVGHIWRFAGLDPSQQWEKGEKRPYNAELKQICWHAGQCFMKQSNDPDCFYGKLYREKKQEYIARNEAGGFAEKAKGYRGVSDKANKALLAAGKVPAAYIDSCARRFAVKIFLSHLHAVLYWHEYKKLPPLPFALSILGHAHNIEIPHADMFPGLSEAYRGGDFLEAAE